MASSSNGYAPTKYDLNDYIQTVNNHAGGNWCPIRFDHLRYLKGDGDAAVILAYILNLLRMKCLNDRDREVLVEDNFWFECPAKTIREHTRMNDGKLRRALTTLKEAKLISWIPKKGVPPTTWVKVRIKTLRNIESMGLPQKRENNVFQKRENNVNVEASTKSTKTRKQRFPYTNNPPKNLPTETSRSATPTVAYADDSRRLENHHFSKNGKHTSNDRSHKDDSPPNSFERKCTNKIWDAIVRSFPDEMRRIRSKHHWDNQFIWLRKFRSEEEITRVLDWYIYHLGDEYVPEAFSAKMFRLKFDSIRRAMRRTQKQPKERMPIN